MDSDAFIREKDALIARSNNVMLLQTENKHLGTVTFSAIRSSACSQWKFCGVSIFGDTVDENTDDAIVNNQLHEFFFQLFLKPLTSTSSPNIHTDTEKHCLLNTMKTNKIKFLKTKKSA